VATIWQQFQKPFLVLAPMDDVTDMVFREVVAQVAPPDIFFTEFTNCDALFSAGRDAHMRRLQYTEHQRPVIAQIWGPNPENYYKTARLLVELGFDGIEINMGCPDRNIRKSGSCSALIENRPLAKEIIAATKEGAGDLPVSVKTRLGVKAIETESWLGFLLEQNIAALTIHGRTVQEMSKVPAHWDEIAKAVALRDQLAPHTVIIGNGDIVSYEQAMEYADVYKVDGIMVGRGIFYDLWIFDSKMSAPAVPLEQKLAVLRRHIELFYATWGETKNPDIMKKFLKVYINGFPRASELRQALAVLGRGTPLESSDPVAVEPP
jgi:tRNA-dihydrouridine synthase